MYLLAILFLTIGLVACSNGDETTNNDNEGDKGSETENTDNEEPAEEPSEDDTTYTITALDFNPTAVAKDGPGVAMINERFNIDYQVDIALKDGYKEKLTTTFSTGSIPDLVGFEGGDANYVKYAKQNAFLPLDDYIDDYPTLQRVPDAIWDSLRVDGKIYAIPNYLNPAPQSTAIRTDWLENLGLEMPTNYEELKEVALAFTNDDPDGNGEDDTYGILTTVGPNNIFPFHAQGPYWDPETYYTKNEDGNFIPTRIGDGWKELVTMFHDLYQEGALNRDFHTLSTQDGNTEFYSGKTGIWIFSIWTGFDEYARTLVDLEPNASIAPIPAFEDPTGKTGWKMNRGYSSLTTLSAELAGDEGKIKRILDMIEFGRQYYPEEEQTPDNEDFDWIQGKEGQGYSMVDGKAEQVETASADGLAPEHYLPDAKPYLPEEANPSEWKNLQTEVLQNAGQKFEEMHKQQDYFYQKRLLVQSPTENELGQELKQFLVDEHAKMIVGERPLSDWDAVVEEWYAMGGDKIVEEYNQAFEEQDLVDFDGWIEVGE